MISLSEITCGPTLIILGRVLKQLATVFQLDMTL